MNDAVRADSIASEHLLTCGSRRPTHPSFSKSFSTYRRDTVASPSQRPRFVAPRPWQSS